MSLKISILLVFITICNVFGNSYVNEISSNATVLNIDKNIKQSKLTIVISSKDTIFSLPDKLSESTKKEIDLNISEKFSTDKFIIYNGIKCEFIKITGLNAATKYYVSIFADNKSIAAEKISFSTLDNEPMEQSSNIIFKDIMKDRITLIWKKGSGKNNVVFARKGSKPAFAFDAKTYKSDSVFGSLSSFVGEGTYCVYNGSNNHVTITGLESDEFYFEVFDYNGSGETTNYLTIESTQNPRSKFLPLPAPLALNPIDVTSDGFTAKWEKVKGAVYYEIDISSDESFSNIIEPYNHMDIGNIAEMEFIELASGIYYYRLAAVGKRSRSDYSNSIKVEIK